MKVEDVIKTIEETKKVNDFAVEREKFDISFDISPNEFLKFSEKDLTSEVEHKYVNALSNAKRAIDGQIEGLLKLYGFYKLAKKKSWGFPKKLECLSEIGIITPRVLIKLNKQRNIMEHEFIKPDADKVEDFVDIATLFIGSTDRFLMNYLSLIESMLENPERAIEYELIPEEGIKVYIFDYTSYDDEKEEGGEIFKKTFTVRDEGYRDIAKVFHELSEINPFIG